MATAGTTSYNKGCGDCSPEICAYTYFCGGCASADIAEVVEPGSWWPHCLFFYGGPSVIPCVGFLIPLYLVFNTRQAYEAKAGIIAPPSSFGTNVCPDAFCCACCMVVQEQEHLKYVRSLNDGHVGAGKADPYAAV